MNYSERYHTGLRDRVLEELAAEDPSFPTENTPALLDQPETDEIYLPASTNEEKVTPVFAPIPQLRTLNSLALPGHNVLNLYETPAVAIPEPIEEHIHVVKYEAKHLAPRRRTLGARAIFGLRYTKLTRRQEASV